ncbi:hypothetical protein [Brucella intermedia]|uniref:hypothetical protein n=1 Tax=Brucella intermedia TaxID=94625 RepID=UPI003CE480BF
MAAGCAAAFRAAGADLAVTYLNDKAVPFVRPVADALGALLFLPGVRIEGQIKAVFDTMAPKPFYRAYRGQGSLGYRAFRRAHRHGAREHTIAAPGEYRRGRAYRRILGARRQRLCRGR